MFWECAEKAAAEICPSGLPDSIHGTSLKRETVLLAPNHGRVTNIHTLEGYSEWKRIVQQYSDTQLTNVTDKLVALSGLAKRMKVILNDDYVAGIWRKALPEQLFWTVTTDYTYSSVTHDEVFPHPTTYIAPTWSWASVNDVVWFGSHFHWENQVSVVDVKLEYSSSDPTGAITSGYLDLKGWLRPISFTRKLEDGDDEDRVLGQMSGPMSSGDGCWTDSDDLGLNVHLDSLQRLHEAEKQTGSFYCMMGGTNVHPEVSILYTMLLKTVDQAQGVYERIGIATIHCYDDVEDRVNRFKTSITETSVPCRFYSEGMHTVRII
jgi:hypothetical protein